MHYFTPQLILALINGFLEYILHFPATSICLLAILGTGCLLEPCPARISPGAEIDFRIHFVAVHPRTCLSRHQIRDL